MTRVMYFQTENGNPVKDFIHGLTFKQRSKIFRIFSLILQYGIRMVPRHIKKISNTPLLEIRTIGQDNIRLFYTPIHPDSILLLHGYIKKTQKTNARDLSIALNRYIRTKDSKYA